MPEMDGKVLVDALKSRNPNVKVILMTGYPLNDEPDHIISDAIVSWLQKPVDLSEMARVIDQALAQ